MTSRPTPELGWRDAFNPLGMPALPATAVTGYRSARQDVIGERERADGLLVVLEGWAVRYKQLADGRRQILAILLPGDCAYHPPGRLLDYAIGTLTPLRYARMSHNELRAEDQPGLAQMIWRSRLLECSIAQRWLTGLGQLSAYERITHLLCEIHVRAEAGGMVSRGTCEFPLTQQDIAHATGLTSVHVNRTLQQLRHEGLFDIRGKHLYPLDVDRARRVAGFDPSYLDFEQALPLPF